MSQAITLTKPQQRLDNAATRIMQLPCLAMRHAEQLKSINIAYETWGRLDQAKSNAILLFTGLSPSAHAASSAENPDPGWWEYMIGPGKPLNTDQFFIICVNSLGSCFGSTGPASINPDTNEHYRLDFPPLSIEDIAEAGFQLINQLGIERLHCVIGASLGGMCALALSVMHPQSVEQLVSISAATSATPFAIALRSLQREMIMSDPDWHNGNYPFNKPPVTGLSLARKLGISSYRSPEEWLHRFGRQRNTKGMLSNSFSGEFAIENYLQHNADKFAQQFDANCYLYLSRAMDWFDISEHGDGEINQALQCITAKRSLIIGVKSDILFPVWQQQQLSELLAANGLNSRFVELDSPQGHDSFLVDKDQFSPLIHRFFS